MEKAQDLPFVDLEYSWDMIHIRLEDEAETETHVESAKVDNEVVTKRRPRKR